MSESQHPELPGPAAKLPKQRRLTLLALACLIFFTTSGGPFGLEPLVGAVGPGLAVILLIATPFLWSIPIAFMAAELTAMMPDEGGYYVWVTESLGSFWGVQEAWWSMGYALVLLASFPVLFVTYLGYFFPALATVSSDAGASGLHVGRWLITILVALTATGVNLLGSKNVGRSANLTAAVVIGAFLVMIACWLFSDPRPAEIAHTIGNDLAGDHRAALLLGLSIIVFNYSGWDNASTYASEVENPQRTYPIALALALVVVVLNYLVPVIAGISLTTDPAVWSDKAGWPMIAQMIGGPILGYVIAAAGLVSMWALFNAQLLYVSRLPYVMARDGWLPPIFAGASARTGAPTVAIATICVLTVMLTAISFNGLTVIVCLLNVAALTLEFLALIVLRWRLPGANRPFRVPGGWPGIFVIAALPFAFAAAVIFSTLRDWRSYPVALSVVAGIVVSGIAVYLARRSAVPRTRIPPDRVR